LWFILHLHRTSGGCAVPETLGYPSGVVRVDDDAGTLFSVEHGDVDVAGGGVTYVDATVVRIGYYNEFSGARLPLDKQPSFDYLHAGIANVYSARYGCHGYELIRHCTRVTGFAGTENMKCEIQSFLEVVSSASQRTNKVISTKVTPWFTITQSFKMTVVFTDDGIFIVDVEFHSATPFVAPYLALSMSAWCKISASMVCGSTGLPHSLRP